MSMRSLRSQPLALTLAILLLASVFAAVPVRADGGAEGEDPDPRGLWLASSSGGPPRASMIVTVVWVDISFAIVLTV